MLTGCPLCRESHPLCRFKEPYGNLDMLTCRLSGLSHPFLGMGPGPLELGKISAFPLKLGNSIMSMFPLLD